MRRMLIANGLLAIAAAALLSAPWPASAATETVDAGGTAGNYAFAPQNITINVGDTVEWSFTGDTAHNVTADDNSFASGDRNPGATFSRQFGAAGSVPYYCSIHGAAGGLGMSGTITVQAAATNTPGPPTNTPQANATATRTPDATDTPDATNTPAAVAGTTTPAAEGTMTTQGPPLEVIPISAPDDGTGGAAAGGARPALTAPSTGTGDGLRDSDWRRDAAMALAIAGAGLLGAAMLSRRRA